MMHFRIFLSNLLGLCGLISGAHNGLGLMTGWQPPSPTVSPSPALGGKQSLVVSWSVSHGSLVGDISEVQVSRTENHIVVYSENVSVSSADEYVWSWTSDLPLECVDHSVRVRHFYKQSVVSHWSNWTTNPGAKAKDGVQIFPFQTTLREGTSAVFCCVPPQGQNVSRMDTDDISRPLISVGARVKAVTVDKLIIKDPDNPYFENCFPLTLSCYAADHTSHIFNYITSPPQKPRNLSCETSDKITVRCIWDLDGKLPQNSTENCPPQTQTLYIENSDQAPIVCQHSSCTFPAIPLLEEYSVRVVVRNIVGEEAERHSFNISDRVLPVVQPGPVRPGVTDATVSWMVAGNLTRLLCQVDAAPQGTTDRICDSANCRVQLERLVPNTNYSTRIRCSVSGRLWGMWTRPQPFTTCPQVSVNLWRTLKQWSNRHDRQVTLVWTLDVPGSATKVEIQGYVVQWWQRGQNRTEMKESGQSQAMMISIGPEQYNFTVEAVFHAGRSAPAHITIPEAAQGDEAPVEKRLSSSTVGGFNLSWAEQVSATCGYTVEWCIQGHTVPCTLQWMKIPGRNTSCLPAGNFRAGCRYTFNIYGCTENGHRLLEIQTGYSQELEPVQLPSVVEPIHRTSSSVLLEWRYDEEDPQHPAFITGYLVQVLPGPSASLFNVSVADPRRKSVTIEGLQENHEYTFFVSALTKNGPGKAVRVTITTTTNYSAHLAKMLTPFFLLLGCVVLLWPQRKMLKNGLKEIFAYPAGMNIKTSELDAFLNKADETVLSHKVEECISCDIEILNPSPPPEATASVRDPEPTDKLPTPCFQSFPSRSSLDYCPQSSVPLCDAADGQHTCITNQSYFHSIAEDKFSSQQVIGKIQSSFEPEGLQESCSVIYGYISKEAI